MIRFSTLAAAAIMALALAMPAAAQCSPAGASLTTTYAGGNGCSGNFFDVQAATTLTVCSFDVHIGSTANETVEVWAVTGGGSYQPVVTNQAAWTLLATVPVTAAGAGVPTPLNLSLGYTIPGGTTQGFIIRLTSSTNIDYTNGVTLGAPLASNSDLTILEGEYTCTIGATFPVRTALVRRWNGTIHYSSENILSVSQSAPGAGDLSIGLGMINPAATEGWLLLSFDTSLPVATGPLLGIVPDATTFQLFFTSPLADGNIFHFPIPSQFGLFPSNPFTLPPGSLSFPSGFSLDVVGLLVGPGFSFVGRSNVVRLTF